MRLRIFALVLLATHLSAMGPDGSGSIEIATGVTPWHQTIITVWPNNFGTASFERDSSLAERATVTVPIVNGISPAANGSDQDRCGASSSAPH